jgi:hypothetical protein
VNLPLLLLFGFAILLILLLAWVLRDPRKLPLPDVDLGYAEDSDRRHVTYFPQVRQARAAEDSAFLASRAYLACLRGDFLKLWRLARVIASMAPQVGAAQELERLRLGLAFSWRYEMIRMKFLLGFAPLPDLGSLSEVVSRLSIRLEATMKDLGERAALGAKLASSLEGRGLDTP